MFRHNNRRLIFHDFIFGNVLRMRFILIALLFSSSLFISACNNNKPNLEGELLLCMQDISEQEGVNLDRELNNYEQILITAGVLENNSGSAYYNFYNKVANGEKIEIPDYDPQFLDMFSFTPCYILMMKNAGSSDLKFTKIWLQMQKNGASSKQEQSKTILNYLNEEDFSDPFYKMVSLYSIYNFHKKGLAIPANK